eukprot:c14735_g1_i2 orf=85-378(+)
MKHERPNYKHCGPSSVQQDLLGVKLPKLLILQHWTRCYGIPNFGLLGSSVGTPSYCYRTCSTLNSVSVEKYGDSSQLLGRHVLLVLIQGLDRECRRV